MNPLLQDELRVRQIIDDALNCRQRGESLSDETILAAHSELAEPLQAWLKRLHLIKAARALAEQPPSPDEPNGAPLVRCPGCSTLVTSPADNTWDEISCPTCGNSFRSSQATARAAEPPQRVAHFEVLDRLGAGSFGEVWEARDTRLDRRVAIKLPRRGAASPRETELFLREARAAAKLRHPHIVAVYEIGQEGDQCYIVSELVSGLNVAEWLAIAERSGKQIARLGSKIARALDHAHRAGVVHRDLKPANVLVDADDEPHLLDFGLAKRETTGVSTLDGHLIGTVAYMSPEQAGGRAHECSPASDIYSLGVMLFEMLTTELPFRGAPAMVMQQILHDEPPSPRRFKLDVPRDLETITLKCLEKEPAKRYVSAAALADDLDRFVRGEAIWARPVGRPERLWRWCRRNQAVALLAAAVMIALLGGTTTASYFAIRAGSALSAATAATEQVDVARELAVRSAYNAQLARASSLVPHARRAAWELLSDEQRCPPRLRDFAWHYAAQIARQEGHVLRGHTNGVNAVVYSPDGLTLASGSRDGTIRLWNTSDWSERATLSGHKKPVNALAYSPDANVLFSAGDDWTVRRWNLQTGAADVFASESAAVKCLAASADGKLLAWAVSGLFLWAEGALPRITLCDAASGANRKQLVGHKDLVTALLFSADGRQLISGGYWKDPTVRLWDTASGKCTAVIEGHEQRIGALALGPESQTLMSAGERIRFWDLPSGAPKQTFANNPALHINALALAPNGLTLAVGNWSRQVTIVDTATGSHVATLDGHDQQGVFSLAFSRDGSCLASAGADAEVHVWNLISHMHPAEEIGAMAGPLVEVADVESAGLLLGVSREDQLSTWHSATGQPLRSWPAGHGEVLAATGSSDRRRLFTTGRDGMVRVWDVASASLLNEWRADDRPVRALALTPDDALLISANLEGAITVWNATNGTRRRALDGEVKAIHSLAASVDGVVAAGTGDGQIHFWDSATGRPLRTLAGHTQPTDAILFYADGKRLASGSADTTARIWDTATGKCLAHLRPQQGPIRQLCVSPDEQTLATTGYKLALWDAVTGQERAVVEDPRGFATCAAFSLDGRRLITGYDNGWVRLRRLAAQDGDRAQMLPAANK